MTIQVQEKPPATESPPIEHAPPGCSYVDVGSFDEPTVRPLTPFLMWWEVSA